MNHLYPFAIDTFITRELRSLCKKDKQDLHQQVKNWIRKQDEDHKEILTLPEFAPAWAYEEMKKGTPIIEFTPSQSSIATIRRVVAFIHLCSDLIKNCTDKDLVNQATKIMKKKKNIKIEYLLEKHVEWNDRYRAKILASKKTKADFILKTKNERSWVLCETKNQLHKAGTALGGNCLQNGFYDEYFDQRHNNGLSLYILYDKDFGSIIAIASFFYAELDDFEVAANSRLSRQKEAKKYSSDLHDLLLHYNLTISSDKDQLISRVGIYEQSDVNNLPKVDLKRTTTWSDDTNSRLIIYLKKSESYMSIPLELESLSGGLFTTPYRSDQNAYSLYNTIEERLPMKARFHGVTVNTIIREVIAAISDLIGRGELCMSLNLFHEYKSDVDISFWDENTEKKKTKKTKIGDIVKFNDTVWWEDIERTNAIYRWFDGDKADKNITAAILERVNSQYGNKKRFFYSLMKDINLSLPDFETNENNEPVLNHSILSGNVRGEQEGWKIIETDKKHIIKHRRVDDYKTTTYTEQWVCERSGYGLVAGILLRNVSPRKNEFYMQAKGRDPEGYNKLISSLPTNCFSEFKHENNESIKTHDTYLALAKKSSFQNKKQIQSTSTFRCESNNTIFIFDANEQLVLILKKGNDSALKEASLIGALDSIHSEFHPAMSSLGIILNSKLNAIAKKAGYQVKNSQLHFIREKPQSDTNVIEYEYGNDFINIHFNAGGDYISIYDDGYCCLEGSIDHGDDNILAIQNAALQVIDYFDISPCHEIMKGLNLLKNEYGYKTNINPVPSNWILKGDNDSSSFGRWEYDSEIELPCITFCDGEFIILANKIEYFQSNADKMNEFISWYEK
jgi:hypothetical protein